MISTSAFYEMYFNIKTSYAKRIENYFAKSIKSNGYEWYNISKEEAKSIILKLF